MTETSPITTALPLYGMKVPGSVGIPLPDTEAKLVDPGDELDGSGRRAG